jgi:hypothetical protein
VTNPTRALLQLQGALRLTADHMLLAS